MQFIFVLLFSVNVFAGNWFDLSVFSRRAPKEIFSHPSLSEKERLEDDKFERIAWSAEKQARLNEIKRQELEYAHNAHAKKLAKAGISIGMFGGLGAQSVESLVPGFVLPAAALLDMPVNQERHHVPGMIFLPGTGGTAGSGGGGGDPGDSSNVAVISAADVPEPNQYTDLNRRKLKEEIDKLLKQWPAERENLFLALRELQLKAKTSPEAEEDFIGYCTSHRAILRELGDEDLLRFSVIIGKLDIVKALIDEAGCYINHQSSRTSIRPVEAAIESNQSEIFNFLVNQAEFNPNTINLERKTLFELALDKGLNLFITSVLSHPAFRIPKGPEIRSPNQLIYGLIVSQIEFEELEASGTFPEQARLELIFDGLIRGTNSRGVSFFLTRFPELAVMNKNSPIGFCKAQYGVAYEDGIPFFVRQNLEILKSLLMAKPDLPTRQLQGAIQDNLDDFVRTWIIWGDVPQEFFDNLNQLTPHMHDVIENARDIRDPVRMEAREAISRYQIRQQENAELSSRWESSLESSRLSLEWREKSCRRIVEGEKEACDREIVRQIFLDGQEIERKMAEQKRQRLIQENNFKLAQQKIENLQEKLSQEPVGRLAIENSRQNELEAIARDASAESQNIQKESELKRLKRDAQLRRHEEALAVERSRFEQEEAEAREQVWGQIQRGVTEAFRVFERIRALFRPTGNLLSHAIQALPVDVRDLLWDEQGNLRSWSKGFLRSDETLKKAIQDKKLSVLKEILAAMEKLGLSPGFLLRYALDSFPNAKKGSEEFRIIKELKESVFRTLQSSKDSGTIFELLKLLNERGILLPQEDWVSRLPAVYRNNPYSTGKEVVRAKPSN